MVYQILYKVKVLEAIQGIQGSFEQGEIVYVTDEFTSGNVVIRDAARKCYAFSNQVEKIKE